MSDYNKFVRPVTNMNRTVLVTIDVVLYSIMDTNEAAETITISNWLRLYWIDEYLRWNPEDHSGITEIKVPYDQIWSPDIVIYGMVEIALSLSAERTLAKVYHNGSISVTLAQLTTVHCAYNIQEFPFDTQNCSLHFGSWIYNGQELDMYPKNPLGETSIFQPNSEWEFVSLKSFREEIVYTSSPIHYTDLYYHLNIRRKPLYYIFAMVLPSFVITTLSIVGLFTPFNAGGDRQEKISLGVSTLLAMAVMLMIVADQMPKTSDGLPMIGIFLMVELMLTTLSCILAVGIMYLHHGSAYGQEVPIFLRKITFMSPINGPKNQSIELLQSSEKNLNSNLNVKENTILEQLKSCIREIREVQRHLLEMDADSARVGEWMKLCDRLDLFFLILFLLLNFVVTFAIYYIIQNIQK